MLPTSALVDIEQGQTHEEQMGVTLFHAIANFALNIASVDVCGSIAIQLACIEELDESFATAASPRTADAIDNQKLLEQMYLHCITVLHAELYPTELPAELTGLLKSVKDWHLGKVTADKMRKAVTQYTDTYPAHPLAQHLKSLEITNDSSADSFELSVSTTAKTPRNRRLENSFISPRRKRGIIDIASYAKILKAGLEITIKAIIAPFITGQYQEMKGLKTAIHLLTDPVNDLDNIPDEGDGQNLSKELEKLVESINQLIDTYFKFARNPEEMLTPAAGASSPVDSPDIASLIVNSSTQLPPAREGRHALLLSPQSAHPQVPTPDVYQHNLIILETSVLSLINAYLDPTITEREAVDAEYRTALNRFGSTSTELPAGPFKPSVEALVKHQFEALKAYMSVAPKKVTASHLSAAGAGAGAGDPTP